MPLLAADGTSYRWNDFPAPKAYAGFFIHEDGIELLMKDGDRPKYLFADAVRSPSQIPDITIEAPPASP